MSNRGFLYHAYALGVSGRLNGKLVEPQAASALPPAGGFSSASWSNYQLDRFFSYDEVATSTNGADHGDDHRVVAVAEIKGFHLGGFMSADSIRVELVATHKKDAEDAPKFTLDETGFEGLVIAGEKINLVPRFPLRGASTAEVREKYDELIASHVSQHQHPDPPMGRWDVLRGIFAWFKREHEAGEPPVYRGVTVVPLYTIDNPSVAGKFEVHGNLIHVVGAGFIQLGQLVMRDDEWRVTMVQVHLETPRPKDDGAVPFSLSFDSSGSGGTLSCASVGSNGGHTDPPVPKGG